MAKITSLILKIEGTNPDIILTKDNKKQSVKVGDNTYELRHLADQADWQPAVERQESVRLRGGQHGRRKNRAGTGQEDKQR